MAEEPTAKKPREMEDNKEEESVNEEDKEEYPVFKINLDDKLKEDECVDEKIYGGTFWK